MTIEPRAIQSIASNMGLSIGEITPNSTFTDLGMDSLDELEMVMGLEDEFEIEIADSVCETWNAVSDAISYIQGAVTP